MSPLDSAFWNSNKQNKTLLSFSKYLVNCSKTTGFQGFYLYVFLYSIYLIIQLEILSINFFFFCARLLTVLILSKVIEEMKGCELIYWVVKCQGEKTLVSSWKFYSSACKNTALRSLPPADGSKMFLEKLGTSELADWTYTPQWCPLYSLLLNSKQILLHFKRMPLICVFKTLGHACIIAY